MLNCCKFHKNIGAFMKSMIFVLFISSLSINAMLPDHKMDLHKKRCKDDLNKGIVCMAMNCSPFMFKTIRQDKKLLPIVSILAVAQGCFLYDKFMNYRLAQRGEINWHRA
jgi:hypothetical protein